jgi:hypothetical protein
MTEDERNHVVATAILAGLCPFGEVGEGLTMAHCPLGFPGCGCADELAANPELVDVFKARLDEYQPCPAAGESNDDEF